MMTPLWRIRRKSVLFKQCVENGGTGLEGGWGMNDGNYPRKSRKEQTLLFDKGMIIKETPESLHPSFRRI
jgi:hypothetical protein